MQEFVLPNLTTILMEFIPSLVMTALYLIYIGSNRGRRNTYIEVFILIMYTHVFSYFLRTHLQPITGYSFDPTVGTAALGMIFLSNFVVHLGLALQDYMIWIMVSFYSAVFCFLLIVLSLVFWRRQEIMHHLTEWREKSDYVKVATGKAGRYVCLPKTDLVAARKEYFIIGLATIIPSLEIYTIPIMDVYLLNILVFLTWIYRFGYPASGRIADNVGFFVQEFDFEHERSHFGGFFKVNILISIVAMLLNIYIAFSIAGTPGFEIFVLTYLSGLTYAFVPIIFAVLVLPIIENYATIFCVRLMSASIRLRAKFSAWRASQNTLPDLRKLYIIILFLFLYTIVIGPLIPHVQYHRELVIQLPIPYILGVAYLNHVYKLVEIHWRSVFQTTVIVGVLSIITFELVDLFHQLSESGVVYIETPWGRSNLDVLNDNLYIATMLLMPMLMIILLGHLGHRFRDPTRGGLVSFAFVTGFLFTFTIWGFFPEMDYIISSVAVPVEYYGFEFARLSTFLDYPGNYYQSYSVFIASWIVLDAAMKIFVFLLILYFLRYNRTETSGIGFSMPKILKRKS